MRLQLGRFAALTLAMAWALPAPALLQPADQDAPTRIREQAALDVGEDLAPGARALLLRARVKEESGRHDEAAKLLGDWLSAHPNADHYLLRLELASCLLSQGRDAAARTELERAVKLAPRYGRAWLRLGEAAYRLNDGAAAGEAFARAGSLMAEPPAELRYYEAAARLQAGQPAKALALLESLLEDHAGPAPTDWHQALVAAAVGAGRPERARPWLAKLRDQRPSDPKVWELSYQFEANAGDLAAAASFLKIVDYLRPVTAAEAEQLGNLFSAALVPGQAALWYEKAWPDEAVRTPAQTLRVAGAWQSAHDAPKARAVLTKALLTHSTPDLWQALADLEYAEGHLDAARRACVRLVELDPERGRAWLLRGWCARELGDLDEAREALRRALAFPDQMESARVLLSGMGS